MLGFKKKNKKISQTEKQEELDAIDVVDESPQEQDLAEVVKDKEGVDLSDGDFEEEDDEDEVGELSEDGQLSVDVWQDKHNIIIKSTIAGVEPEDIDITFDNDMLTIRGKRQKDTTIDEEDYFYQECYWGGFSRSIILPVPVNADKIKATIRNGVLTISLPKSNKDINIKVQAEE